MCFSLGLGPTPFIHSAESAKRSERGQALTICVIVNWLAAVLLTAAFPLLQLSIDEYAYLVLMAFATLLLLVVAFKVSSDAFFLSSNKNNV